jgi:hypothetical protein
MAHLFLPIEHSEADLVLAGQIAELIDSAELYVAWTPANGLCAPSVEAELRAPGARRRRGPVAVVAAIAREVWRALRDNPRQPLPVPTSSLGQSRTRPAA